jgi:multimeric flavodoxin WrbA
MKKIVALLGSPRKESNSADIAQKIMDTAAALGAEGETYSLYQLDYSGCIACMGCKKTADECVLRDDLTTALRAIRAADILIVASPVYFGQVTGPMKCALDRMYSFMPPTYLTGGSRTRLAPGKHCVAILTQGSPDPEAFAHIFPTLEQFLGPEWFGFQTHLIRGVGMSAPGAATENAELMQQAEALAQELTS